MIFHFLNIAGITAHIAVAKGFIAVHICGEHTVNKYLQLGHGFHRGLCIPALDHIIGNLLIFIQRTVEAVGNDNYAVPFSIVLHSNRVVPAYHLKRLSIQGDGFSYRVGIAKQDVLHVIAQHTYGKGLFNL